MVLVIPFATASSGENVPQRWMSALDGWMDGWKRFFHGGGGPALSSPTKNKMPP